MEQIKMFSQVANEEAEPERVSLENQVNDWLKEKGDSIRIVNRQMSVAQARIGNNMMCVIMLSYVSS